MNFPADFDLSKFDKCRLLVVGDLMIDEYVWGDVDRISPEEAVKMSYRPATLGETFGPVVSISRYSDIDEAIRRANDSTYGLGAVVYGSKGVDIVAEQLEAGMIGINQGVGGGGDAPWVGAKQSGFGFHGSPEGHRQFAQVRVVSR